MRLAVLREFVEEPKRLLLIDIFGALATSLATAFLLAAEIIPTGLPVNFLYVMAIVAGGFFATGLGAFWFLSDHRHALRWLAVLNVMYCLAILVCCAVYSKNLTMLGLWYFSFESVIVVTLAFLEFQASRSSIKRQK